jgi:flagellar basal-body rod protein FlgF
MGASGGQVEFATTDTNIEVRANGEVFANGEQRGDLGVYHFNNPQQLRRTGDGFYKTSYEQPITIDNPTLIQGALEGSNVNQMKAMSSLIEVSRGIERTKKLLSSYNDLQMGMIQKLTKQN